MSSKRYNLGSQVAVEELVRFTKERRIDALLASQAVTQKGSDIKNFTALERAVGGRERARQRRVDLRRPARDQSIGGRARLRRRVRSRNASQPSRRLHRGYARRAPRARAAALVSKTALVTGITGQDGSYLAELLLAEGLSRRRDDAAHQHRGARAHRAHRRRHRDRLGRPSRPKLDHVDRQRRSSGRNLQSRRAIVRAGLVEPAGVDRRVHRARRHPRARSDSPSRSFDSLLSSVELGDVRQSRRDAAARDDAVLSAQSLRRREGHTATGSR